MVNEMNKNYVCPKCAEYREVSIRQEKETYPVRGEDITVDASVAYCACCGEQVWVDELDNENLKKAFDVYREKYGLLSPEKIKAIREKYDLTQTSFAKILGLGDKTITRYEGGNIPDAALNNLILLAEDSGNFDRLLERGKGKIPVEEYKKASAAIHKINMELSKFSYTKKASGVMYRFDDSLWGNGGLQNVG